MTISSTTQRLSRRSATLRREEDDPGQCFENQPRSDRRRARRVWGIAAALNRPGMDRECARGRQQLRGDVVAVSGYDRVVSARHRSRDESQLYGLLVPTPTSAAAATWWRRSASSRMALRELSSTFNAPASRCRRGPPFTRAVEHDAPRLLSRATKEALAAVPSLDAAALSSPDGRRLDPSLARTARAP